MRYIRRQSTNARGLVGKGVNYTVDDEVRLDSAKAVMHLNSTKQIHGVEQDMQNQCVLVLKYRH